MSQCCELSLKRFLHRKWFDKSEASKDNEGMCSDLPWHLCTWIFCSGELSIYRKTMSLFLSHIVCYLVNISCLAYHTNFCVCYFNWVSISWVGCWVFQCVSSKCSLIQPLWPLCFVSHYCQQRAATDEDKCFSGGAVFNFLYGQQEFGGI